MRVYEKLERFQKRCPIIHDADETIDLLATSDCSISRFGDGELFVAFNGISLPFQRHNDNLAENLRDILKYPTDKCVVGLPHPYFYKTDNLRKDCEWYIENCFYDKMCGGKMMDGFNYDVHYYDTNFGIFYHHYDLSNEEVDRRFEKIKDIVRGKKIILVTGDRKIENYGHNIFTDADVDVKMVYSEPKDAFLKYSTLRKSVLDASDGRLVVAICGPCATVLSYDLSNNYGLRCLDMGHFAKEYNFFKSGLVPYSDSNEPVEFFTT